MPADCGYFDGDGNRCLNDAIPEDAYCDEHYNTDDAANRARFVTFYGLDAEAGWRMAAGMTDPMAGLPARSCNDPEHEALRGLDIDQLQQDAAQGDAEYGTPCLVCGAPIIGGYGHDEGCMAADTRWCACEQYPGTFRHRASAHAGVSA